MYVVFNVQQIAQSDINFTLESIQKFVSQTGQFIFLGLLAWNILFGSRKWPHVCQFTSPAGAFYRGNWEFMLLSWKWELSLTFWQRRNSGYILVGTNLSCTYICWQKKTSNILVELSLRDLINGLVKKDTANPLSHQVMASSYRFSFTHALAPNKLYFPRSIKQ